MPTSRTSVTTAPSKPSPIVSHFVTKRFEKSRRWFTTQISKTKNSSARKRLELIASTKGGGRKDCRMMKSCGAVSNASTRSTPSSNADDFTLVGAKFRRRFPLLGQAWVHLFRWTDWSDRDHADRASRTKTMDQPVAISPRAQLLHALARAGSAAVGHLHRVASS